MRNGRGRIVLMMGLILGPLLTILPAAEQEHPNLLIIQTSEHHTGTLGCYGGSLIKRDDSITPHLDRLASEGAIATSFYATTPESSPARAALQTGRYPQKSSVVRNEMPLPEGSETFAAHLKAKGYVTGAAGLWHLAGRGFPEWSPQPAPGWTDQQFQYNRGYWKKFILTGNGPQVGARNARGQLTYDLDGADETTYATDWLFDRAKEFLEENREGPFCYLLSLPDPHSPNSVRPPYDKEFSPDDVNLPESLNRSRNQIPNWGMPDRNVSARRLQQLLPAYFGAIQCIDDNMGEMLDFLERQKLLENTILVFTSDYGNMAGAQGRLGGDLPYEASARVPMLIRYPEAISAGTRVDVALSSVDFFPTISGLLKLSPPERSDGRDASGWFTGQEPEKWDDVTFVRSTQSRQWWLCAVSDQYKLVYSSNDQPWLFDLENDPRELTNLAGNTDYDSILQKMSVDLKRYAEAHDDPYFNNSRIRYYLSRNAVEPEVLELKIHLAEKTAAEGLIARQITSQIDDTIYLHPEAVLTNRHIAQARVTSEASDNAIEVTFTPDGSEVMQELSNNHQGKRLAILINDEIMAAPYIRSTISEKAIITGAFSRSQTSRLVKSLNSSVIE